MNNITEKRLIKIASYLSLVIAVIIMSTKIYGWHITGSQSIFISLVDSMLDIFASAINFVAIRISFLPPDNDHRFGHEKFQDLAIFSQSIFFITSCMFSLFSAFKSLFIGSEVREHNIGINVMYISIFFTIILVSYQYYVVKKTNSQIIMADKLHYFSDLLMNFVVLTTLYISDKFWYVDSLSAIFIGIYLLYNSYKLLSYAISNLVDKELPQEEKDKIISIIKNNKNVKGLHEIKTRRTSNKIFIQFHIELNGSITLYEAHNVSDSILEKLLENFPKAEIIIHQDPEGLEPDAQYKETI